MDDILRWLPVVTLLIQGVVVWIFWSMRQQFVTRTVCEQNRLTIGNKQSAADDKASDRLNVIETGIPALPTRTEFQDLSGKIEKLTEKLGKVDGRMIGLNRAVDLLNQHHLRTD